MKILIAVDGSVHSKKAIEAVAKLARAGAATDVTLVNARAWPIVFSEASVASLEQIEQAEKSYQEGLLAQAQTQATQAGLKVTGKVAAMGEPAAEIVRAAAECGAEQIAMGTHGRGAVGSLFIGSVAQRVAHLSNIPVLLAK
jgi:nucleotide-binding universal stress UspA family protein